MQDVSKVLLGQKNDGGEKPFHEVSLRVKLVFTELFLQICGRFDVFSVLTKLQPINDQTEMRLV